MKLSEQERKKYAKRIMLSRMRLLCDNPFYGLLLMHLRYGLDEECKTACTDGKTIWFDPFFLDRISEKELDFVLMHEVLHCVLRHVVRGEEFEHEAYNIAADIVVNSNIMHSLGDDLSAISIKGYPSMHVAPNGAEGYNYTTEEVYAMLRKKNGAAGKSRQGSGEGGKGRQGNGKNDAGSGSGERKDERTRQSGRFSDDHSKWQAGREDELGDLWVKRFQDACDAVEIMEKSSGCGNLPAFAKRLLKEIRKPQVDWRTVLNNFIQEEVNDYSFTPPDRRYDGDFFLPAYSDIDFSVKNVLFMIDTSGSMSDKMVTAAFSEVSGAIERFNGKLKGWLGYFDAEIIEPVPFERKEELIPPVGGGGTRFDIIFQYVRDFMKDNPPSIIIVLTDGYAYFPDESAAMDIPVLWVLNNEEITPPWGKTVRIKPEA